MIVSTQTGSNSFVEDVNSTTGQALVDGPCVIRDITASNDTAGVIVVTFHDAATATAVSKKIKMIVPANDSKQYIFPTGRVFTTKFFCKPNAASLDVGFGYE